MWHASVRSTSHRPNAGELLARAQLALRGVGDVDHEWIEQSADRGTVHLKRRTLDTELPNELRDIRNTAEAFQRLEAAGCPRWLAIETGEIYWPTQ